MNEIDEYVNEVLLHIRADRQIKRRIREDLIASLSERIAYESNRSSHEVIASLGSPAEMAKEYMENLRLLKKPLSRSHYRINLV
ncbi:hypothetical protein [Paenibacillus lentus]|uniref:Uncharacterized protein n=1 Tax=Paenibacillus lentus TaxID=1338368 RepID=A0A3Q8S4Q2_9BACL|nr:hypothetical protein [Paenibacillus lentus]AZK46465.1 hypothetical protein EIM92_10020 [Paenibacillus lentus]